MKLTISNLTYKLGGLDFYYNATITSSIVGVYGPSGAGKSTLLNLICGIEEPKSGFVEFNGTELYNSDNKTNVPVHKRNIGVVFQDSFLFPHLNIKQNLLYSQTYKKNYNAYIKFEAVIDLLKLEHLLLKKPSQLSGGEKQRVAIGRALLSQPGLMLFDEPFSNLDRQSRKEIISYLLKINHRLNIPLLIVSHDLEDILKLTNNFIVIKHRKILATGNYVDIAEANAAPEVITHKRFLNVFDANYLGFDPTNKLRKFGAHSNHNNNLLTTSSLFQQGLELGQKVRLCVHPDDIVLANNMIPDISVQNHIKGKIIKLIELDKSMFVTVVCDYGYTLVAEISISAYEKLHLKFNQDVYCLIKEKAIEVVHVFKAKTEKMTLPKV